MKIDLHLIKLENYISVIHIHKKISAPPHIPYAEARRIEVVKMRRIFRGRGGYPIHHYYIIYFLHKTVSFCVIVSVLVFLMLLRSYHIFDSL